MWHGCEYIASVVSALGLVGQRHGLVSQAIWVTVMLVAEYLGWPHNVSMHGWSMDVTVGPH